MSSAQAEDDIDRYKLLFSSLDLNQDGIVEKSELAKALRAKNVTHEMAAGHAKEMLFRADLNQNTGIDFHEFVKYMSDHEARLYKVFLKLDKNKDGKVSPEEILESLKKLGIFITAHESNLLMQRLDKNKDLSVGWEEWRDFLQLFPKAELLNIVNFWRYSMMIDIGDQLTIPPEFTSEEKKQGVWWRHLVAGGVAGAVSRTITAPLDRLKTMLQVHGSTKKLGLVECFQHMLKEGGIKSLWRGNGTNILKIAPESAVKFAAYEQIKRIIKASDSSEVTTGERFIAGATAGAISQTVIYPMEVIKTRLAVSTTGQYRGILGCAVHLFKTQGISIFFRGYLANTIGILPYAGIDLTVYETLKLNYMRLHPDENKPGVLMLMMCGTMSSTCGMLASYPLALLRTQMQAQATKEANRSLRELVVKIWRKNGLFGFYRGIVPNFIKVLPAVSISYVVYERVKSLIGMANEKNKKNE